MRAVRAPQQENSSNLGVIFCIPSVRCNGFRVKLAIRIHSDHSVLKGWNNALHGGDVLPFKNQRERNGGDNGSGGEAGDGVSSSMWGF